MCLHILENEVKTASEDILVYKVLHRTIDGYMSPVYDACWILGEIITVAAFSAGRLLFTNTIPLGVTVVAQGLHSYDSNKIDLHNIGISHPSEVIARMVIPKNTKYIVGTMGELVSLSLRFDSIVEPHLTTLVSVVT
jgi:hypothetical protein